MIITLGTTPAVGRTMSFNQLSIDSVNRAVEVKQHPAGKALNAARVLHTLGRPVTAMGFLGGYAGEFVREELDRLHLPHDFVMVDPATRICVTVIDHANKTTTELVEESSEVSADAYGVLLKNFSQKIAGAKAMILAGTLPPKAPPDFYADCTNAALAAGAMVVLDAKGEPLRRALSSQPTVVKPNRSELEETVGMKIDSEGAMKTAIARLVEQGPRWVVVTSGAEQTIASDGQSFWKISTPKVPVVSPIGSGDCFAAGLTAAVADGEEIPQACRLGAACGAANAMTSFPGYVRPADVEMLMRQITVTPF